MSPPFGVCIKELSLNRTVDSRWRTTKRTRLNFNFFSMNSKNIDTPEGLIMLFSPQMIARLLLLKELPKPRTFSIVKR